MVADAFAEISSMLGINAGVLIALLIWTVVWKAVALWKSARNKSLVWFIILLVVNTFGILEILYIFIFSKMQEKRGAVAKKKKRR